MKATTISITLLWTVSSLFSTIWTEELTTGGSNIKGDETLYSRDGCSVCQCQKDSHYGGVRVDCGSRHLTSVPKRLPERTTTLYLDFNDITTISEDALSNLEQLRYIDMGINKISTLPPHVFNSLRHLEYLNLDENRLTSLPEELFENVKSLRQLNLNHNPLHCSCSLFKAVVNVASHIKRKHLSGKCDTNVKISSMIPKNHDIFCKGRQSTTPAATTKTLTTKSKEEKLAKKYQALNGKCSNKVYHRGFGYQICFNKETIQYESGYRIHSMGKKVHWNTSHGVDEMTYTQGDYCGRYGYRSTIVDMICGSNTYKLLEAWEEADCAYRMKLETTYACNNESRKTFTIERSTTFQTEMKFFKTRNFTTPILSGYKVTTADDVFVQIKATHETPLYNFFVEKCYATPGRDADSPEKYTFFINRCKVDQTFQNLNSNRTNHFLFKIRAFSFSNEHSGSSVFFHCQIVVCKRLSNDPRCSQRCVFSQRMEEKVPIDGGVTKEITVTPGDILTEEGH